MVADKALCVQQKTPVVEVISISFQPGLLAAYGQKELVSLFDDEAGDSFTRTISPCTKSKLALEQMVHHPYEGILKNIFLQSKAMELLIFSSDQFIRNNQDERFGCRFLTHDEDRLKIIRARDILLTRLDSPITIRELARKVAMNECYLKKGFKAMFGTTVYDYFQKERMERARTLLYEQGLSVSEVALQMGYSCISHFSTAFKKHTGLRPCELLR
jgi:AraC-like DNA-binding protein